MDLWINTTIEQRILGAVFDRAGACILNAGVTIDLSDAFL